MQNMQSVSMAMTFISILIAVAFYTMLERKLLGYIQLRKGPNKVSLMGILQPMADALKLFTKSNSYTEMSNYTMSYIFPSLSLLTALMILPLIPQPSYSILDSQFNMISFLIISSLAVYITLGVGWSSNSKYSQIGSIRNVAQMISYEISFFLIIINVIIMSHSLNMIISQNHQLFMWFIVGMSPLFMMWLLACLAEVNRSPFDFAEGESELVSGFNVEYSAGLFALIFLAEYTSMILLSIITAILFTKLNQLIIMPVTIALMMLWARGTLPRFRYDMLMNLNWKAFLPMTLMILPLTFSLSLL